MQNEDIYKLLFDNYLEEFNTHQHSKKILKIEKQIDDLQKTLMNEPDKNLTLKEKAAIFNQMEQLYFLHETNLRFDDFKNVLSIGILLGLKLNSYQNEPMINNILTYINKSEVFHNG